jgi:hypothetical protein
MGLIQQGHNEVAGAGSVALTLGSPVSVNNRLVIWVYTYGAGITLTKVSDGLNNQGATSGQYDQVVVTADTFNGHLYGLTAPVTAGGSDLITATASGSASYLSMWAGEYDNLGNTVGSTAWDVTSVNHGTIATSMGTGTTGAVTAAGETAIAAFGDTYVGGTGTAVTSPGGWNERFNDTLTVTNAIPLVVVDKPVSNGSTVSADWTYVTADGSNTFAAAVIVFTTTIIVPPLVGGFGGPLADITGGYWMT